MITLGKPWTWTLTREKIKHACPLISVQVPTTRLGWFKASLANVLLTNLQGPILPKNSRGHINPNHASWSLDSHHFKMSISILFIWKFRFFSIYPITVMLNMPFSNGHNLWVTGSHKISYTPIEECLSIMIYTNSLTISIPILYPAYQWWSVTNPKISSDMPWIRVKIVHRL